MVTMSTQSVTPTEQILELAREYFGGGMGLRESRTSPFCVDFEGEGNSHITVSVRPEDTRNVVEIDCHKWEEHVRQFLSRL